MQMTTTSMKPLSAAVGSTSTVINVLPGSAERNKQWQRELLMERIRSHASQQKNFVELSKSMRMSMLEKRYALDSVEKSNLQKCLDSMQHCIKVTSRQGLVERLESLSRQLGLKFMDDTTGLFISTDMFYLEILLDTNGILTDVKVHHECKIEQQSCVELVNCLNRGDFVDFTTQLEGLSSIYQLNAEPKVKTKAFVALQAIETDLYNIFQSQNFTKDTMYLLNESTVGIVLKRRGGHPMKLTYFVSPYDLISLENKIMQSLTIDLLLSKNIGFNVTVNLEASSANKLQILPTVTFTKDTHTGIDVPVYAPLTQSNSTLLPATFVLRLNKSLPVCSATLRALGVTGIGNGSESSMEIQNKQPAVSSIMNLIVQIASEQMMNFQKGLFVCLPDQTHCYFFTENKQLEATLVSAIPFTEPSQVPKILSFLKQQALFYTLLSSCVRSQSKMGNDMDSTTILEVNAISIQQISVSLQHPYEESMATVDFALSQNGSIKCTIYCLHQNYDMVSMRLTRTAQKSLSIPLTIRALLKYWDDERLQMFHRSIGNIDGGLNGSVGGGTSMSNSSFGNFNVSMGLNDSGGRTCTNNNGTMKIEPGARLQMQLATVTSGHSMGESIKFKNELKKEDFLESPKSQMPSQSVEVNSLGQNQSILNESNKQMQTICKATDIEIAGKYKNIWKNKTSNLKNCVSITPILSESSTIQKNVDIKSCTTGIEIIPLTAQNHNSGANMTGPTSTITITPINSVGLKEKKTLNNSSTIINSKRLLESGLGFESQKEKKRKKKRDDSPMGPPEKVFSRQNSPASGNDVSSVIAIGSSVTRKFSSPSSSPKSCSGGLLGSMQNSTTISTRPSPKHSPVYSSPKHNTSSNSPKSPYGTQSPKHGSSGKPSMSTLKNATATNLSPKTADSKNNSSSICNSILSANSKSRDKDKTCVLISNTGQGTSSNPTLLSSSITGGSLKSNVNTVISMQQLKPSTGMHHTVVNDNLSGSFGNASTSGNTGGADLNTVLRKNVTSAVRLMTPKAPTTTLTVHRQQQQLQQQQDQQRGNSEVELNLNINSQSSEYMVKSSQEGLKLTINKTSHRFAASKTKNNVAGSFIDIMSSKKQHTGLKPGVNSGPASKKLPTTCISSGTNSTGITGGVIDTTSKNSTLSLTQLTPILSSSSLFGKNSSQNNKHVFQKSNSSGSLGTKSTILSDGINTTLSKSKSTHSFSDLNTSRKLGNTSFNKKSADRERDREKSINLASSASQPPTRLDHHVDMMKILQYASPTMAANMEGFIKGINSKFHIPKISQRNSAISTSPTLTSTNMNSVSTPTTPTTISPPAMNLGNTSASSKPSSDVPSYNNTSTALTQNIDNMNVSKKEHVTDITAMITHQQSMIIQRSPPPPYHIAIAGGNPVAPATSLSTVSSVTKSLQTSTSVHIHRPTKAPPIGSSSILIEESLKSSDKQQEQHQELNEYLKSIPIDESLLARFGVD